MYSVFLVEDEIVIREGIKQLVAWEDYGFRFCGEAPDGELAWPLIQREKPDIVLTDIKMPFVDGLELSKMIRKELPDTTIIILSGHDDFSYAQEAIRIGVSQYLLKPLSKEQLVEVLLEVKKKKDEEVKSAAYSQQFAKDVQAYLTASRRDFFEDLVAGRGGISEIFDRADKLGLNLLAQSYNVVLLMLEEDLLDDTYSPKLAEVQENIADYFLADPRTIMFSVGIDISAFLICGEEATIAELSATCCRDLDRLCAPLQDTSLWSVAAGEPVSRLSAVGESYKKARKALLYGVLEQGEDDGRTRLTAEIKSLDSGEWALEEMDPHRITRFLTNGLPQDVVPFVESYLTGFGEESVQSLLFRHYIVMNAKVAVGNFVTKLGIEDERADGIKNQELGNALSSVAGAKQYLTELLAAAIELRDSDVKDKYSKMLLEATDYLKANYADPEMSLKKVAQVANVSPTHFSTIFSRRMGRTFVEYLTDIRMEKARELLRCTSEASAEIAHAVGYNDPHYFSFLFKKVNGCSPRVYRAGKDPGDD